jgi:hypothetical protein
MTADDPITRIIDSASRLGVALDEQEARAWISAMGAESVGGDIVVDVDSGVFGHRSTMLDLDHADLAHFRRVGKIVGIDNRPGVATALALSGSAAQGLVHEYPADADFFERVNISAGSRDEACAILAEVIRDKALATLSGPTYRLSEVKFGTWDSDVVIGGAAIKAGSPMSWTPAEVEAGQLQVGAPDGQTRIVTWADAARDPGWCKLDWVVADPTRGQLANASNMLDATWEAPDGTIVPLDGFLDPYFQEVYLDTEELPLFERIIKQLSHDAVEEYVEQLDKEVYKYSQGDHANWGKVARRLYNVFRLQGRYPEAVYVRELFDEPTTVLYQVAALVRTVDEASVEGTPFGRDSLLSQCDQLIMSAIGALTGPREAVVVAHLLRLRDQVSGIREGDRGVNVLGARDETMAVVNEYFRERLLAVPSIAGYIDDLAARKAAASAGG